MHLRLTIFLDNKLINPANLMSNIENDNNSSIFFPNTWKMVISYSRVALKCFDRIMSIAMRYHMAFFSILL